MLNNFTISMPNQSPDMSHAVQRGIQARNCLAVGDAAVPDHCQRFRERHGEGGDELVLVRIGFPGLELRRQVDMNDFVRKTGC